MEEDTPKELLKKTRTAFFLILIVTILSFVVVIRSIDSNTTWRIVCSGIGLAIGITLTTMVYLQMLKLLKK